MNAPRVGSKKVPGNLGLGRARGSTLGRWLPALAFTAIQWATLSRVPAWREEWFRQWSPEGISSILLWGGFGLILLASLWRLHRNRDRLVHRVVWAVSVAVGYALCFSIIGLAVEKIHLVQYGLITLLYFYPMQQVFSRPAAYVWTGAMVFGVAVADEWIQFYLAERVGTAADVWMNSVSMGLGLVLAGKVVWPQPASGSQQHSSNMNPGVAMAMAVALGALFLQDVTSWGHRHEVPGIGRFFSHYSKDALHHLDSSEGLAYGKQVAALYPVEMHRYLKKQDRLDPFLAEALVHLFRREVHASRENYRIAWRENLILERFYPKTLMHSGLAWSLQQRDRVAAHRPSDDGQPYESPVAREDLLIGWNPWSFWGIAFLLIAICLMFTFIQGRAFPPPLNKLLHRNPG